MSLMSLRSLPSKDTRQQTNDRQPPHENLDALRAAVGALPAIGMKRDEKDATREGRSLLRPNTALDTRDTRVPVRPPSLATRLKRLSHLLAKGLITAEEHAATRARILAET